MRVKNSTESVFFFFLVTTILRAADKEVSTFELDGVKYESLFDGKSLGPWKSTQFGGEANVVVEDGALHLDAGTPLTGVTYQQEMPKIDYEIVLEAQRVSGNDFFCGLTFPVNESHCSLILGGWGGAVVGLSSINGEDASENETSQIIPFKSGQWYRVRIRVTDSEIKAWLDGKEIISAATTGRRISTRPEVELSKPLGIASFQTHAAIRKIGMRRLGP